MRTALELGGGGYSSVRLWMRREALTSLVRRETFGLASVPRCVPVNWNPIIAVRFFFCRRAGRELSKLAIAWQAAAYGSDPAVFTPELMASVTDTFLEQKVRALFVVFLVCMHRADWLTTKQASVATGKNLNREMRGLASG